MNDRGADKINGDGRACAREFLLECANLPADGGRINAKGTPARTRVPARANVMKFAGRSNPSCCKYAVNTCMSTPCFMDCSLPTSMQQSFGIRHHAHH
jgi:hypothetical protein